MSRSRPDPLGFRAARGRVSGLTLWAPVRGAATMTAVNMPNPLHTILIVDDHAGFRVQVRAVLEADGFEVIGEAADGQSGLEAARAFRPDIVLLDIGLPDVEGFEVAQALAEDGAPPPLVVLTSTRDAAAYGPRIRLSHALGFIAKDELSGAAIRRLAAAG
jgi:DNA-binding NarL/FixJ family response regulator